MTSTGPIPHCLAATSVRLWLLTTLESGRHLQPAAYSHFTPAGGTCQRFRPPIRRALAGPSDSPAIVTEGQVFLEDRRFYCCYLGRKPDSVRIPNPSTTLPRRATTFSAVRCGAQPVPKALIAYPPAISLADLPPPQDPSRRHVQYRQLVSQRNFASYQSQAKPGVPLGRLPDCLPAPRSPTDE